VTVLDTLLKLKYSRRWGSTFAQWPYKMAERVPSAAPATRTTRGSDMQLVAKGRGNSCTPCTIFKFIAYRHRGHRKTHIFHCENFFASFSTCAQSVPPRIQSRVPPPSCASGTTHLMSCTLGHGQSMGLFTHTSVSWQRYSEQETVINKKNKKYGVN
jgi:hypothetical protein